MSLEFIFLKKKLCDLPSFQRKPEKPGKRWIFSKSKGKPGKVRKNWKRNWKVSDLVFFVIFLPSFISSFRNWSIKVVHCKKILKKSKSRSLCLAKIVPLVVRKSFTMSYSFYIFCFENVATSWWCGAFLFLGKLSWNKEEGGWASWK